MSLVIAAKSSNGVAMVADRRITSGDHVMAASTKLRRIGNWVIGTAGSAVDDLVFFRGLPPDFDFSDPFAYADRCALLQRYFSGVNTAHATSYVSEFHMLAARGDALYQGNPHGLLYPVEWAAIGDSALPHLALHELFSPSAPSATLTPGPLPPSPPRLLPDELGRWLANPPVSAPPLTPRLSPVELGRRLADIVARCSLYSGIIGDGIDIMYTNG